MPGIAEYEIPRDLRDQREEKQVLSVFAAVPRVKEALDQKETEDREGRSADITDDAVPGDLCGTNGKEYPEQVSSWRGSERRCGRSASGYRQEVSGHCRLRSEILPEKYWEAVSAVFA